jgi:hypothetical protein
MIRIIVILVLLKLFSSEVLALSPPILQEPQNNSTVDSPSFSWQEVEGASQYRIIVDDENSISSPYLKNYYTTNNKYSPTLEPGTYYWKVSAKDSNNNWSIWSEIYSVAIKTSSQSTPQPSASQSNNDYTTPKPVAKSSFNISELPSQIKSSESLVIKVDLILPNNPSSVLYLKGALKTIDGSNYFGLTKVDDSWIKNNSSYSSQFKITTDSEGKWSGTVEAKVDHDDSGFNGTGDYIIKIARYSSSGSGPNWSNVEKIHIIFDAPEIQDTNSPTPIATSISEVAGISKEITKIKSSSPGAGMLRYSTTSATISPSANSTDVQVKSQKSISFLPILGGLFIISSISYFLFIKFKSR